MKTMLLRTTSAPGSSSLLLHSPRGKFSDQESGTGICFSGRSNPPSPKFSLHVELKEKNDMSSSFRRVRSETDLILPEIGKSLRSPVSNNRPAKIAEEEPQQARILENKNFDFDYGNGFAVLLPENDVLREELGFVGGNGRGWKIGGGGSGGHGGGGHNGGSTGDGSDHRNMVAYYEQMIRANPGDPLLLRNYGKYLHEVVRDLDKAEEYYGRAILASPGDGEVLSLYGNLIWESQRDEGRAQTYFDQAIRAAPDDCYVLGSYAHFLWDAEDEDNKEGEEKNKDLKSSPLVKAY